MTIVWTFLFLCILFGMKDALKAMALTVVVGLAVVVSITLKLVRFVQRRRLASTRGIPHWKEV